MTESSSSMVRLPRRVADHAGSREDTEVNRFLQAAATVRREAEEARSKAAVLASSRMLGSEGIQTMRLRASLGKGEQRVVAEDAIALLDRASKACLTDPMARHMWLGDLLTLLERQDPIHPLDWLRVLFAAMSNKMPRGNREAIPVFKLVPLGDVKRVDPQYKLPVSFVHDGTGGRPLRTRGRAAIIPTVRGDQYAELIHVLRTCRERALTYYVKSELVEDSIHDLASAVRYLAWLLPRVAVVPMAKMDHFLDGKSGEWASFVRTPEEVLLLPKEDDEAWRQEVSGGSMSLTELLAHRKEIVDSFWTGVYDEQIANDLAVMAHTPDLVEPRQFLNGKPGDCVVITPYWQYDGGEITVHLLLTRDGEVWRWVVGDSKTVRVLFGEEMRYRGPTRGKIPSYLQACLMKSTTNMN